VSTTAGVVLETARRRELHHALILHGPSLQPLRDLAVRIAKTLNCLQGTTGDDCTSCLKIDRRIHPDVHFAEVSGEKKMISVEQIREMIAEAALRPYEGRSKVFVIDPADGLSVSGSNSLLKTLEEPSRDTTFLLLTRSPDLLLPTIRSRSQSIYVAEGTRTLTGPLGERRLQQVALVEDGGALARACVELLHRFAAKGDSAALLALAASVGSEESPRDAFAILAATLCDLAALPGGESIDPGRAEEIRAALGEERLVRAADACLAAIRNLPVNADSRLLAEQVVSHLIA
jgi:hypothetical protein